MKRNRTFISSRDRRTPLYERAVAALKDLLAESGPDTVERAFAEAAYDQRFENTEETVKGRFAYSAACVERLRGKRCSSRRNGTCESDLIPSADHTSGYVRDRRVVAIVTEPYDLSFNEMRELVRFCEERGLCADVDAESSHFPSRTLRIIIRNKDDKEHWRE